VFDYERDTLKYQHSFDNDEVTMRSLLPPLRHLIFLLLCVPNALAQEIRGELRKWHKVTLAFTGPAASETDVKNPFLDYRFDVTFRHASTGKTYKVPGYFAADGDAANTSSSSGNKWHCHFAPDEIGQWSYVASIVTGRNVSISSVAGVSTSFHGQSGTLNILASNKSGRDHRGKGLLRYVGRHHLQFAGNGEWFLKVGADRYV
jgi:Domain of unknown function (DUF5060)